MNHRILTFPPQNSVKRPPLPVCGLCHRRKRTAANRYAVCRLTFYFLLNPIRKDKAGEQTPLRTNIRLDKIKNKVYCINIKI
jgi:hypothetical protein